LLPIVFAGLSLLFVLWGVPGFVFTLVAWTIIGVWAGNVYYEALHRYWHYRNLERQYSVLKMKRYTILRNVFDQLGTWTDYERDVLATAAGTSQAATLLTERFPQIRSLGFVQTYLIQLSNIEGEINKVLSARVRAAANWFELADNNLINAVLPKRDVPRDLLGHIRDPIIPADEVRMTMAGRAT